MVEKKEIISKDKIENARTQLEVIGFQTRDSLEST